MDLEQSTTNIQMKLFIVMQYLPEDKEFLFQGVFDDESLAVEACRTENYCVCPAILNENRPHEKETWDGAWYPLLQKKPHD